MLPSHILITLINMKCITKVYYENDTKNIHSILQHITFIFICFEGKNKVTKYTGD